MPDIFGGPYGAPKNSGENTQAQGSELSDQLSAALNLDVIRKAKKFVIGRDGWILGLTAGDQFFEPTGIQLSDEDREIYNAGLSLKRLFTTD